MAIDTSQILQRKIEDRQRARTDLLFLSREVLQYADIDPLVHKPLLDALQKFKGGNDLVHAKNGVIIGYKPACSLWELTGPRFNLLLYPRGHLKTTLITISHSIQWIINYPDIRILQSMATGDQVAKVMGETLAHFRWNERFRFLFPEFCPPARSARDFGNMESFTVPCRTRKWLKEPTVSTCSVGKVVAGGHYEVLKDSDLVDKENVKTPNQIREVKDHFRYMDPLLERGPIPPHHGWRDTEGTHYDFADVYGDIKDKQEKLPPEKRTYQIVIGDAEYAPDGTHMDENGGHTLFEKWFPKSELMRIKQDDPFIYAGQYRNRPVPQGSGLATREELEKLFVPHKVLREIQAALRLHCTIDLAGMDSQTTGDFTVLTVAGFDRDGRCYVLDVRHGRFTVAEVIDQIYDIWKMYKLFDMKIEKEAHARVLMPFITRESAKRGVYPILVPIQRDNRTAKKARISSLQPWFKAGIIRFNEDIPCKLEIIQEIVRFSQVSTYHDDILDTLADQMQNRDGGVLADVIPDAPGWDGKPPGLRPERFLGFANGGEMWDGESEPVTSSGVHVGL